MEKDFWRRITHDEIITDYNTKAVNVDAYQRRGNNSDSRKSWKQNPTTDEQFISKALRCSILSVVEKASLVICKEQFSFLHRTSQVELSSLLLDTFFKSSTLPWKNRQQTASWSFFLKLLSRYNRLSKQSFVRFQYCAGLLVTSPLAWLLRGLKSSLSSLANSWNSIPRYLVSMGFQELSWL